MDCIRLAEKTQSHHSFQTSIILASGSEGFAINGEEEEEESSGRRSRGWSGASRITYAKLLLSYLMNNLQVNGCFFEYLGEILKKSSREISIFHRKMVAEHRSAPSIVKHVLRSRLQKPSHQTSEKTPSFTPPSLMPLTLYFGQQEQLLDRSEEEYLRRLVFAEESLEQYEEDLSDNGQVGDLDDLDLTKEHNTNDSFDSDQNHHERGFDQEDPNFDYFTP